MAENDIYNSEKKYERFKNNINEFVLKPERRNNPYKGKYYCKNKDNIKYFKKLFSHFEAQDLSYIRRIRVLQNFKIICYSTNKNLSECNRKNINNIAAFMHSVYMSPKSKSDFIKDIKYLWKLLFPEKDGKGRADETIVPYVVKHLKEKIDKSREKLRKDTLTWEEYEQIVNYFSNDPKIQLFITLILESLGRPQETLYTRIGNCEIHDNYAKVYIGEHGKEGTGFLQCIDSFPYLAKWLNMHPQKDNKDAFLFINYKGTDQLKPNNINKKIRKACKDLKIDKKITCYSLKRSGVTLRRLSGDSDVEIQHAARWASNRQLKTYDQSTQDQAMMVSLIKKGIIKGGEKYKYLRPETKKCLFCGAVASFSDKVCSVCFRPLDREELRNREKNEIKNLDNFMDNEGIQRLFKIVYKLQKEISEIKDQSKNFNSFV